MGASRQLLLEFMVNHISPASPQFQDYLARGEESPWADMFIHWGRFWPQGKVWGAEGAGG
jgi:sucrose phosphorylase